MKTKYILLILTAWLTASCSLQEDTEGFSTPGDFYKTKTQCQSAVNSCYIPLKNLYTYKMMIATEGVTDLMYIASGTQDAQLDISPSQPRFGADMWTYGYRGVMYCNMAVTGIENSTIDEKDRHSLVAEAKVLRAFYYYLLTSFFGDVPFYTDDVSDHEVLDRVAKLPRMSAEATRTALIEDLESCLGALPLIRTSEAAGNRAGAAMGHMLIAKLAMWNKDYDKALEAIAVLEQIYGDDLSVYPVSDIPFRMKNTPESIFEVQHTYTAGGLIYTSNVASICMPYPRNSDNVYSNVVIEELGDAATTWSPLRPNSFFYGNLMPEGGEDLRRDMQIITEWNGVKFTSGDAIVTRPFMGPKFWCPDLKAAYDSNNYKVFRYADAVLMAAECYCALLDKDKAMEYLNKVKRRAGIAEYTRFRTYPLLLNEIQNERGRELLGEFQRKFDMVRWGIWYERTAALSDYAKVKTSIQPCHEYYPIPDTEVIYSGGALDNNEYKKYGF